MYRRACFASVDVEHPVDNIGHILEIFKKNGIRATLFVTGEVLEKYGDLAKQWSQDCEIASHSFTHRFWNTLDCKERENELDNFIALYRRIFGKMPVGFRAPSHIIDKEGLRLLEKKGFLYDSSVVPHYPPFKKYRGYNPPHQAMLWWGGKGKFPLVPYFPLESPRPLEIPVSGQLFGIPLAGAWITKLPLIFYKILFFFHCPEFITLNIHSWDGLKNFEEIIRILKSKRYQFFNGEQIYQNYR